MLAHKKEKAVYNSCGSDEECNTALIGGSAAGNLLPTMIIYNNKRISAVMANNFPDDFVIGKSETGWMTSGTFYEYIVNHFHPWLVKNKVFQ